jgi:hypothetical protein
MRRAWPASLLILVLVPPFAVAQTVNGSADWGYGRSTSRTGDEETENDSFTQAYTVGYQSILWDPRFLTYSGELTFHKNALSFGPQDGTSRQTGFKTSATLFPARHFPLSVNASRTLGGETANYPTSNPVRGGLTLPTGDVSPLKTGQSALGVNWMFNNGRLPRAELSYQNGSATMAVGSLEASQRQSSVHALIAREGPRLRNSLRYDRNRFDNALSQAFTQRYAELSYELFAAASPRTSATVRAGRRSTFSLFDVPRQFNGIGDVAYRPPATGEVGLQYGTASVSHARSRLSADLTASYDRERSDAGAADALLGVATTRYNLLSGLTLSGSATYGTRGQLVNADETRVITRSVAGGADYALAFRFLQASAGYDEGHGRSTGELGDGRTRSWRSRAHASTGVLRLVDLNIAYERGLSRDDILEFGNQWHERTRATARSTPSRRLLLEANWEQSTTERGRSMNVSRSRYVQNSGTAAFDLSRDRRVSVSMGRFLNRSFAGDDSTDYVGLSLDGTVIGALRLTITARREHTYSDASRLDQSGYFTMGAFEYRVRLFTFAVEHRYTDLALSTAAQIDPVAFTGNQILFRVGRRFAFVP